MLLMIVSVALGRFMSIHFIPKVTSFTDGRGGGGGGVLRAAQHSQEFEGFCHSFLNFTVLINVI